MLIVDDHEVVHWGFRLMLGEQPWVERCLSARTGDGVGALRDERIGRLRSKYRPVTPSTSGELAR